MKKYRNPHGQLKEICFSHYLTRTLFRNLIQLPIWQHAGEGTRHFNPLEDYRFFNFFIIFNICQLDSEEIQKCMIQDLLFRMLEAVWLILREFWLILDIEKKWFFLWFNEFWVNHHRPMEIYHIIYLTSVFFNMKWTEYIVCYNLTFHFILIYKNVHVYKS